MAEGETRDTLELLSFPSPHHSCSANKSLTKPSVSVFTALRAWALASSEHLQRTPLKASPALEYFIAGRHLRCHLDKPVFYDEEAEFGNYGGVGARLLGVSETTPALGVHSFHHPTRPLTQCTVSSRHMRGDLNPTAVSVSCLSKMNLF